MRDAAILVAIIALILTVAGGAWGFFNWVVDTTRILNDRHIQQVAVDHAQNAWLRRLCVRMEGDDCPDMPDLSARMEDRQ